VESAWVSEVTPRELTTGSASVTECVSPPSSDGESLVDDGCLVPEDNHDAELDVEFAESSPGAPTSLVSGFEVCGVSLLAASSPAVASKRRASQAATPQSQGTSSQRASTVRLLRLAGAATHER
jgi:hypothetical protein